ncbi:MAG: Zn-ribbon containing protein [Halanaeroarchaeum sp.]
MPHLCTNCGQSFPDGSKEMLSGCPECGGNKFQYLPESALDEEIPTETPPDRPGDDAGVTDTVGRAATSVRDYVTRRREANESRDDSAGSSAADDDQSPERSDRAADPGQGEATDEPSRASAQPRDGEAMADVDDEDDAQASARTEMVDRDDLPDETISAGTAPPGDGRVVDEPDSSERPDLEELREELNDQFESIKILEPGQYELNLMELYDREEHIIALQEDGRYMIEVPDTWREDED